MITFLELYIRRYYELLVFIAGFVLLYVFFMHWLNVRFLNRLRQPAALVVRGKVILQPQGKEFFT